MLLRPPELFDQDDPESVWLRDEIPYFECDDPDLQCVYYFRWRVYRRHIRKTPVGYVVTEFLPDVPWAGAHNTISCAAGHHFYEGRWLRSQRYLDDYSAFWFRPEASPRSYSFPLADALVARARVTGDIELPIGLIDPLVRNCDAWKRDRWDPVGLFWQVDDRDGMEFQISGSGCRPTINSYMFADYIAIAHLATTAGRHDVAEHFIKDAIRLRTRVNDRLWDDTARFYKTLPTEAALAAHRDKYGEREMGPAQSAGQLAGVRELQGYLPWTFGLAMPGREDAWAQLADPNGFAGSAGMSTAERRHPAWQAGPDASTHDCLWRGSSWPFATSHTLMGLARLLATVRQSVVTEHDYLDHLRRYAAAHRLETEAGTVPWIDESMHPDTGEWVTRTQLQQRGGALAGRGADYNHSTFADLIITGLVGLTPRDDETIEIRPSVPVQAFRYFCLDNIRYHGRNLTIAWDRDGSRYGHGAGLRVFEGARLLGASDDGAINC